MDANQRGGEDSDWESLLPDLRDVPFEELAGDEGIAADIARYLPQMQADVPVSSFNSSI